MGIISKPFASANTTQKVDATFDKIYDNFNGNISNNNISPNANINEDKLDLNFPTHQVNKDTGTEQVTFTIGQTTGKEATFDTQNLSGNVTIDIALLNTLLNAGGPTTISNVTITTSTIDGTNTVNDGALSVNISRLNAVETVSGKKTFSTDPVISGIENGGFTQTIPSTQNDTLLGEETAATIKNKTIDNTNSVDAASLTGSIPNASVIDTYALTIDGDQTVNDTKTFSNAPVVTKIKRSGSVGTGHTVPNTTDDTFTLNDAVQTIKNKVIDNSNFLSADSLTTGTLPDARLSTNIPKNDAIATISAEWDFLVDPQLRGTGQDTFDIGDGLGPTDKYIYFDYGGAFKPYIRFNVAQEKLYFSHTGDPLLESEMVLSSGTPSNSFSIGDGLAGNKEIIANNADVNKPKIRYNDTSNEWEYSNDGVVFAAMGSGGAALASAVSTDTTNFDGVLSVADVDVQAALETIDDMTAVDVPFTPADNAHWGTVPTETKGALDELAYPKYIDLSTVANPSYLEGRIFYDTTEKALSYYSDVNGVTMNLGQENVIRVTNKTGAPITNGSVVYINGAQGDRPTIALARADAALTAETTIGVVTNDIADNGTGYATTLGLIHDLNTLGYSAGDLVYLSPTVAGTFTATRPSAPNYQICIGVVTKVNAATGHIFVHPRELQDKIRSIVEGGTGANTAANARKNLVVETAFSGLEPSGAFVVTYDATARQFTVTSTNGEVYAGGNRYDKNTVEVSAAHTNTSGKKYCYYDSSGVLQVSDTVWTLSTHAPVAQVYYNATDVRHTTCLDERHPGPSGLDDAAHEYLHTTRGTQYISGLVISGITQSSSTANNAVSPNALDYAVTAGVIADEDLRVNIAQLNEGDTIRILHRAGVNGDWTYTEGVNNGILTVGGDLAYNKFTGATWQQTAAGANNRWVNYFVFAQQNILNTTGAPHRQISVIQGQTLHTSLANATAETVSGIAGLSNLITEAVFLYRITYRRMSATNSQIESLTNIISNPITVGGTFSPSNHSGLTGRSDANSHPASAISTDTSTFGGELSAADDTVQKALATLDDHAHTAAQTSTNTAAFNGLLSAADTDVQKALETLDDLSVNASLVGTDTTNFINKLSAADSNVQLALDTLDAYFQDATQTAYTPGDGGNWTDPDPTTVAEGLDTLAAAFTSLTSPPPVGTLTLDNFSLALSVGSNALTIAAKDKDGNNHAGSSPARIAMPNGSGGYSIREITAPLSFTISSGSTLGHKSSKDRWIYVYLIDSNGSGAMKIGVSSQRFPEHGTVTTVAEGGAGGADSNISMYSDAVYTAKYCRLVAKMISNQSTAGTWTAVPTKVSFAVDKLDPSEKICMNGRLAYNATFSGSGNMSIDSLTGPEFYDSHDIVSGSLPSTTCIIPKSANYTIHLVSDHQGGNGNGSYDIRILIDFNNDSSYNTVSRGFAIRYSTGYNSLETHWTGWIPADARVITEVYEGDSGTVQINGLYPTWSIVEN